MNTQSSCIPLADRFHPIANLFPMLQNEQFDRLAADIRENGLHQPIVEYEGLILDRRNRHLACVEAGIPIRNEKYEGDDPVGYVIGVNLHRRHLNENQRAMIASRLAKMDRCRPVNASIEAFTQPEPPKC